MAERTVHILDDDPAVRRSLERLLAAADVATVSYTSPYALLEAAETLRGGCVLLDIRMPGMDGLEVLDRLAGLGLRLAVVMMTGHGDVQTAVRAMKTGAVDFLEKPFDDRRLLEAIETAFSRRRRLADQPEAEDASRRMAALSPREREVLLRLIDGQANKAIAHQLGISVRTVEVHRARMLERLGCRKVADAVRVALLAALV